MANATLCKKVQRGTSSEAEVRTFSAVDVQSLFGLCLISMCAGGSSEFATQKKRLEKVAYLDEVRRAHAEHE